MKNERTKVFLINPPNTDDIERAKSNGKSVAKGIQHTDWANFPHLGTLSLASHIDSVAGLESIYIDGVVHSLDVILTFIKTMAQRTLAVCLSAITANYAAAIMLARAVRAIDPAILIVLGNDHFSALSEEILSRHHALIDCGFMGNEVYSGLTAYLTDSKCDAASNVYPGCVRWRDGKIVVDPQIREEINRVIDYSLIDRTLPHTPTYSSNFTRRLGKRIQALTGRNATRGVPVEIGRGCIKFSGDDACSFCSIQPGGMWRNALPAEDAWRAIHHAWKAGYDYLYVTADELPLTFARLILDMAESPPAWWLALTPDERPILVGYARADGMEKEQVLEAMQRIGFRILFVGVDAGASLSLQALNKPLRDKQPERAAQQLLDSNLRALQNARRHRVSIKAGFVLGH